MRPPWLPGEDARLPQKKPESMGLGEDRRREQKERECRQQREREDEQERENRRNREKLYASEHQRQQKQVKEQDKYESQRKSENERQRTMDMDLGASQLSPLRYGQDSRQSERVPQVGFRQRSVGNFSFENVKACEHESGKISDSARDGTVSRILRSSSPHAVLGVSTESPSSALRKAYLRSCLMVHPDKCQHPQAGEAFRRLKEAYMHLTEGTPWKFSSGAASSSHTQHKQQSHNSSESSTRSGRSWSCDGGSADGGDPFEFFRQTAEQAFRAGDFSREDFSNLFGGFAGQPAAIGGAVVGAAVVGGICSLIGGGLGSMVAASASSNTTCRCRDSIYGRCENCRARKSLDVASGSAAGGTIGLAVGAALGAAVGASLGRVVAEAAASHRGKAGIGGWSQGGCSQEEDESSFVCPNRHPLCKRTVPPWSMGNCAKCSKGQQPGMWVWSCSLCRYEVCQTCGDDALKMKRECTQQ